MLTMNKVLTCLLAVSSINAVEAGIWDQMRNSFISRDIPKAPTIKVLIAHDVDAVTIEVKGKYNLYDPYKNKKIASRFGGKGNLMQTVESGLKWGEEFPGVYQILMIPDSPSTTSVIDGIEYRGAIYVYDIGGTISIVNEVDIEDYVNSILSQEISAPRSDEALAAVAITVRTNAYHAATSAENQFWHVNAHDVDYQGHAITGRVAGIDRALANTRYMVMSKTGLGQIEPFPAYFATSTGARDTGQPLGLSIDDAETLAQRGQDATQILTRTFPGSSLALSHGATASPLKNIADLGPMPNQTR